MFLNTDGASDSIVSIKLPKSVTYIGTSAFTGCKNLTSVDLPESVTTIEGEFLDACAKLESVVCRAKIPPTFISQTIYGSHSHTTLYVPEESIPLYKKTPIGKVSKTLSLLTTTLVVMEKTRKNLCLHIAMLP